jgi:hypothetical protein
MKKILFVISVALLTACGVEEYQEPGGEGGLNPPTQSTLDLAFVSGHFGSYWDCPDDAFGDEPVAVGAESSVAGDCDDPCGPLNCESAQVTLLVENVGDEAISGLHVVEIQVLDSEGEVHTRLPVLAVDALDLDGFEGSIEAGVTATLRVDFQGPQSISDLLGESVYEAPVRVIIEVDSQEDAELQTPAIGSTPPVAT